MNRVEDRLLIDIVIVVVRHPPWKCEECFPNSSKHALMYFLEHSCIIEGAIYLMPLSSLYRSIHSASSMFILIYNCLLSLSA